jgi:hypothetical protein
MYILSLLFLQVGCSFDEDLPHVDLYGTVRLPIAAKSFVLGQGDEARTIEDLRGIGPIYLGAFPSIQTDLFTFPHPEMGPILNEGQDGNSYPYGGNSIGRFDWACYEPLICKTVTGRFESYQEIIDFHDQVLGQPIRTLDGHKVSTPEEYQERCFEVRNVLSEAELAFVGPLDFEEDGEYLVAEVEMLHMFYQKGMKIWGWVDMPSPSFEFNTCDPGVGEQTNYYDEYYEQGTNIIDLLNFPGKYIDSGDWIVEEGATIDNPEDKFQLDIGFHYVEE